MISTDFSLRRQIRTATPVPNQVLYQADYFRDEVKYKKRLSNVKKETGTYFKT